MCFLCFDWAQGATGRGPQVGHTSSQSHEASWVPVGPLGLPPASFPANYCTGPSSPTRRLRSDDDTPHSLVLGITGKQQLGPAGCTSIPGGGGRGRRRGGIELWKGLAVKEGWREVGGNITHSFTTQTDCFVANLQIIPPPKPPTPTPKTQNTFNE